MTAQGLVISFVQTRIGREGKEFDFYKFRSMYFDAEEAVSQVVGEYTKHFNVKSRNMTETSLDLVIELRTAQGNDLVKQIMKLEGITSVSLLPHDGEVTF